MNAKLLKTWMMVLGFAPFFLTAQQAAAPQPEEANWATKIGQPLIVIATEQGFDQIIKTLLDFGADPNQFDHLENTALNIAAEQGRYALSNLLVQSGANPNTRNYEGIAATDYGSYLNNRELDAIINAFDQTQGTDNP